ncbi:MAG: methyltransferase domain-containing protein [Comamonadaceae bacterium]|nr:MAG: methyltransferase domain-containing protein [Comamonadaceae bacterium]
MFFGPDTSRFTSLITHELQRRPLGSGARILDIGCGGGAGGIVAAMTCSSHDLLLADINPRALDFARGNARLNGLPDSRCSLSDLFTATGDGFDLIVANPPYLVDSARRAYRHGGGALGTELAERIAVEGLSRLAPGGRLVLYTGVPIQDGDDPFFAAVEPALKSAGAGIDYRELDPDVFGEELELPAYAGTDRIAAVALIATGG